MVCKLCINKRVLKGQSHTRTHTQNCKMTIPSIDFYVLWETKSHNYRQLPHLKSDFSFNIFQLSFVFCCHFNNLMRIFKSA